MHKLKAFLWRPILIGLSGLAQLTSLCVAPQQILAAPVPSASVPAVANPPEKRVLFRDNPLLQQKITLEATDRTLGDVLKDLSPTLKVDLSASARIADQRITLHLTDQPLYLLMERLPQLLSHAPDKPHGYYWEPLDRPVSSRPAYNLWRDLRSMGEEQDLLDYPRREAEVQLRDIRNLASMSPQEREAYNSDYPSKLLTDSEVQPFVKALRGLTDDQLDALMRGEAIPLDPVLFSKEIEATKQQQRDQMRKQQEVAKLTHSPDPYPDGIPEPPSSVVPPGLSVSPGDYNGLYPNRASLYGVHLDGIQDSYIVLDPYDTSRNASPIRVALTTLPKSDSKRVVDPVFDLTPLLADKKVTPEQRGDIGFTLQALARTARINLYQEDFLKHVSEWGTLSSGLAKTKGTMPELIRAICAEWNYQPQKIGSDYFFWSRTWAMDRASDIPDRLISRWQKKYQKQGVVTLDDHAEIAAALTWPQMALTLSAVMPEGCSGSPQAYGMYRLLGRLSLAERSAAFSPDGLVLGDMLPWEQQAFAADFQKDTTKVTGDQLYRAVLTFQVEQDGPPNVETPIERVIMRVKSDGKEIAGARDVIVLTKPATQSIAVTPNALI